MSGFTFDKTRAMKADEGGYISTSDVYVGVITKMIWFSKESGSGGVELSLETVDGEKCNYVQIYTKNRDGSENFAKVKIDSLAGILGLPSITAVKTGNIIEFPIVYGKRIAFALQREEYRKEDNSIGWKMNLLHFFYPDTLQTYKEKEYASPPETSQKEIKDILIDLSGQNQKSAPASQPNNASIEDDDLPF